MTPKSQRTAIAETCGNKPHTPGALGVPRWISAEYETGDLGNGVVYLDELPDYPNDLNAMHEAEKVFVPSVSFTLSRYMFELTKIVLPAGSKRVGLITEYIFHATAAQRAEAFLRTVGKWEETA